MTAPDNDTDYTSDDDQHISKSQIKREAEALQKLGTDLIKLTDTQLKQIPLDDELRDAILLARRIQKKHEGFRRQLQFIGKLMRQRDPAPVQTALDDLNGRHQKEVAEFHEIEQWRDRIVQEGAVAIDEFCQQYPQASRDELLSLHGEHLQQQEHNKPPMASRRVFVILRKIMR